MTAHFNAQTQPQTNTMAIEAPSKVRIAVALSACVLVALVCLQTASGTPLDDYVALPDATFSWTFLSRKDYDQYSVHTLEVVSQTWLSTQEVDKPVWRHWLLVVVPRELRQSTPCLWVDGGSNGATPPSDPFVLVSDLAVNTGSIVAEFRMIPNQPLMFADENFTRSEDAIIAYTWDKFLRTKYPFWILQLPMAKATVRAMDTLEAFLPTLGIRPNGYVLAGASKRGWTVWLGAIVDPRVVGVIPIVIDVPNVVPVFNHHYQCYGRWAVALKDYVEMDLMGWLNTPHFKELTAIIDPYEYRDRLRMAKYVMAATGDEFFIPDNSKFYFKDLVGSKYLRYLPNCEHSLAGHLDDARDAVEAWMQTIVYNWPQPEFSWTTEEVTRKITVTTKTRPDSVWVWQVTNPRTRNFMLWATWPAVWRATRLLPVNGTTNVYEAAIPTPPAPAYTAFFVELRFQTPASSTNPNAPLLRFTTDVSVVPDVYPFPPCGQECSCEPGNCAQMKQPLQPMHLDSIDGNARRMIPLK